MTFFKKNRFILSLLLIVFILRIPSLFEPYWYGDEGIYLSIGMAIRKGFLLYRDVFDNKPPLIYLLAALANGRQFWFRLFLSVFVLSSIYFFYRLCLLFFAGQTKKTKFATFLFAFLTTVRTFEGNIANAELFILLPTILGLYLFFKHKERNDFIVFLAGSIFSLGFLFKVPALLDFVSLLVFLVFFTAKKFRFGKREFSLCLGYLSPIVLTGLFFLFKNSFKEFFSAAFLQMMGYLTSWKAGSHQFLIADLIKSELSIKASLVLFTTSILWLKRKSLPPFLIFASLWFVFSLFGATLSARPYPHYLVQILPSLSVLILFLPNYKNRVSLLLPLFLLFLLIFSLFHYRFWKYETISYYKNFILFSLSKKDKARYFSYFGRNLPAIYETAEFINANSNPIEYIFVWANEPSLYTLSRRLPATPYFVAYHINDLKFYSQTIEKIEINNPQIIVVDQKNQIFPLLETVLADNYLRINKIGDFVIYRRKLIINR